MSDLTEDTVRTIMRTWRIPALCTDFAKAMLEWDLYGWDTVYYFEKPWKWAGEMAAWMNAGKPMAAGDPGWRDFADYCDRAAGLQA